VVGVEPEGLVEPFFFFDLSIEELPLEDVVEALCPASSALLALVEGSIGGVVVEDADAGGMVGFTAPGAVDCRPGDGDAPGSPAAPGAELAGALPGAAGAGA
jgi:hypothetical protein